MKINVHAGHGADGSKSCGAVSLLRESTENRYVKNEVIKILKQEKQTIYDCTVDYPNSASDCINQIVKKCNSNKVDLDISIHFNSGRNNASGDGKIGGVEIILFDNSSNSPVSTASRVLKELVELGFTSRGIKYNRNLGVLRNTNAPAMLIEVCFVDDKDDVELYKKVKSKIAKSIAQGILNKKIVEVGRTDDMSVKKLKVEINGRIYNIEGIFKDGTNYIKVRDLEQAGFLIGFKDSMAIIDTPCNCNK